MLTKINVASITNITEEIVPISSIKKTMSWATIFSMMVGALIVGYIAVWIYISHTKNKAFDLVQIGDTEFAVITLFGTEPTMNEKQGNLFSRYATKPCTNPCVVRLWFENRLSLSGEAWSLELDQSGRVINKSRWVSP